MLPTINGKSFLACEIDDLKSALDNTGFKESEYLDYKKSFELTGIPKTQKDALDKAKAEFRKDVCALANAQGGYLIYGIKEDGKGVPHELVGVEIVDNNTEQFENLVKNALQTVTPRIPHFEIRFIPHGEKYVVVLRVYHDFFAPYVFLENNQDYRVYKRVGSSVKVMAYVEMKTMFMQSFSLEKEIEGFRRKRVSYYRANKSSEKFILFHVIPETFLDASYNQPVFVLEKQNRNMSRIFLQCLHETFCQPTVGGLKCSTRNYETECRLYNSGVAECFLPAEPFYYDTNELSQFQTGFFREEDVWSDLETVFRQYCETMKSVLQTQRVYVCFTIVGFKDVVTAVGTYHQPVGTIDSNELLCDPVAFDMSADESGAKRNKSQIKLEYLLFLGIKTPEKIDPLIKEVYEQ